MSASRVGRIATTTAPVAGSTSQRPRRPLGRIAVQLGRTYPPSAQNRFGATVSPGAVVAPRSISATTPSRAAAAAYRAVGSSLGPEAAAVRGGPPKIPNVAHGRYGGTEPPSRVSSARLRLE